jgi:hypothetical protein
VVAARPILAVLLSSRSSDACAADQPATLYTEDGPSSGVVSFGPVDDGDDLSASQCSWVIVGDKDDAGSVMPLRLTVEWLQIGDFNDCDTRWGVRACTCVCMCARAWCDRG